jgi:pimeloyl-ACP methyl ester carboxylesterase
MAVSAPVESQALMKKVYNAFFTPSKYEIKTQDEEILKSGNSFKVKYEAYELIGTTWGYESNPKVLLMHGWGGARAQMTGFVKPLLQAGYFVVAYDQPAHGESDGKLTNVLEISPSMNVLAERFGKFDFVIAHSFGTIITSYAIVNLNFPKPNKLVYFGAFNQLLDALPRFQVLAKLPDEMITALRAMIDEKFGIGRLGTIANATLVKEIHIPALLFHDEADEVTPVDDSRAIAKTWAHAQYIETKGLGHRGALQSKEIHTQVISFLKS